MIYYFLKFNKGCFHVDLFFIWPGIQWASVYWHLPSLLQVTQPSLLQNDFSPSLSLSLPSVSETPIKHVLCFIPVFCLLFWVSPFGFLCFILDYFFELILNLLLICYFLLLYFSNLEFLFGSFIKLLCQFLYSPVPCQIFAILFLYSPT